MASGLDAAYAVNVLNHSSGEAAMPAFSGTLQLKLMSANGSATSNGTESSWTGYTTGGNTITANAGTSPGTNTWPVANSSWTNTSGSTQTVAGVEHWDTAPKRYWWGAFTSSISLPNADTLQFTAAASSNNFP
jgi:hypothetical protein